MKLYFFIFLISYVTLTRAQPIDGDGIKGIIGLLGGGEVIEQAAAIEGGEEIVDNVADCLAGVADSAIEIGGKVAEEHTKIYGQEATGV